eukprot:2303406-Pyramimonas_sp.AAC.1
MRSSPVAQTARRPASSKPRSIATKRPRPSARRQPGPIAAEFETARGCGIYLGRSSEDDARVRGARRCVVAASCIGALVESGPCD